MKTTAIFAICFQLAATVTALSFDPSGQKNVGNGKGSQFIGGQCLNTADCASGCCAGLPSAGGGICSGPGASTQAGKTGCGFGGGGSNAGSNEQATGQQMNAGQQMDSSQAAAPPAAAAGASTTPVNGGPKFDPSGEKNVGNGKGGQFIGGQCLGTADCASGCCAGPSGICSGVGAQTQNGKTGCGFESGKKLVRF